MKIAGRLYYVITALAVFLAGIMMIIWSMTDTERQITKIQLLIQIILSVQ